MHGAYIMPHFSLMELCRRLVVEEDKITRHVLLRDFFEGSNSSSNYFVFLNDLIGHVSRCEGFT